MSFLCDVEKTCRQPCEGEYLHMSMEHPICWVNMRDDIWYVEYRMEERMKNSEIRDRITAAMSSFWWVPDSFTVVDRPELAYCIDPTQGSNQVSRIDASDDDLLSLVREVSAAFRNIFCRVMTGTHQSPLLFRLLERFGFRREHVYDILFQNIEDHVFREWSAFRIENVLTLEQLIKLEQITSEVVSSNFTRRSDEEYAHMLTEYHKQKPRAVRFLARDSHTDHVVGTASMGIFEAPSVVTFFGGCTVPKARNKGVYSALIDARLEYAKKRGLQLAAVYAQKTTSSPIVTKQGFRRCGGMITWTRSSQTDPLFHG